MNQISDRQLFKDWNYCISGGRLETGPLSFCREGAGQCDEGYENIPIIVAKIPIVLIDQKLAKRE